MYRLLAARNRRRLPRLSRIAMRSASFRSIVQCLPPLHDASFQTIMLRSGLRLGLISPVNFKGFEQAASLQQA